MALSFCVNITSSPCRALGYHGALSEGESALVEGERKTDTALFADIKGSMELIEDLDPEHELAKVYGWFTEGSHTADLKDAKALLDELKS